MVISIGIRIGNWHCMHRCILFLYTRLEDFAAKEGDIVRNRTAMHQYVGRLVYWMGKPT